MSSRSEAYHLLSSSVNILINIVLLASKGGAVLLSKSISLIASFVDSALDLLSTAIIYFTAVAAGAKETKTRVSPSNQLAREFSGGVEGATFTDRRSRRFFALCFLLQYPTGKKRFEPLGVLIFSVLMIASFSQACPFSSSSFFRRVAHPPLSSSSPIRSSSNPSSV